MNEPFSQGRRRALKVGAALIAGTALCAVGWAVRCGAGGGISITGRAPAVLPGPEGR